MAEKCHSGRLRVALSNGIGGDLEGAEAIVHAPRLAWRLRESSHSH